MTTPEAAGYVELLADFACRCRDGDLAAPVLDDITARVTDILGIQLAARSLDTSVAAIAFAFEQGGPARAHIVGEADPVAPTWAAFANGVLAHSLDYDDTHLPSIVHPSASVVPAALSVAESVGASGVEALRAIAAGIEVTVRIGAAGYDADERANIWFDHGQHATSICGTIGSACAAALLLGLPAVGVADAMAVSTSMAAGVIEANRTGGTVKRLHCGWAAHAGVSAALLVAKGFTGPPTALEGRFGLFQAFLRGDFDPAAITDGLGQRWMLRNVFFKPYPANHYTHTCIDAALRLRAQGVTAADVESVDIGVAGAVLRTIGEPLELKRAPATGYQAQFSAPYTFSAALIGGGGLGLSLDDFAADLLDEPQRRDLMQRITVTPNARCDQIYPMQFPSIVRVRLHDGREIVEDVLVNRGGPDNPLTDDQLGLKFQENASLALGPDGIDLVSLRLRHLESAPDLTSLFIATVSERSRQYTFRP